MLEKIHGVDGVIKSHHNKLLTSITDQQLEEFSLLQSNEKRFSFVYSLPIAHELKIQPSANSKNDNVAFALKEQGNKAVQSGNYRSALQLYSKSIQKLPWKKESTKELAVTLANRSAALYHLELHLACLQDIDLVLKLDYPKELCYKVLERKARVMLALKQLKDALVVFRSTLTALDSSKLPFERRQKFQTDVQIMIAMLGKNNNTIPGGLVNEPLPIMDAVLPPANKSGQSSRYPSISSAVTIKENNEMGRFAQANKDIQVGEILVTEKAHCSVLLQEHCETHCFHCFKKLIALIPCTHCTAVSFCSIKCQEEALASHHGFECSILTALWESGASITCHMAIRILSQKGLAYFTDKQAQIEQSKELESKKYDGSDYMSVYHLVRHEASRSVKDYLQRADVAVFLFRCLKIGGFFGETETNSDNLSTTEKFVGGLLLRHLQLLQFNAHEISELQISNDGKLDNSKSTFLGGGLYPSLALFNHSCDPGLTRYFCGTTVVAHAIKNINQQEMIAENYGPIFTQNCRSDRWDTLKRQYWFDCTCNACLEDWPLFKDMDRSIMRFRCDAGGQSRCNNVILVPANTDEFMIQCKICKEHTNILKGLKVLQDTDALFSLASKHLESSQIKQAFLKFKEILLILTDVLAPPFTDFHLCQQGIRKCLLTFGNKSVQS